MKLRTKPRRRNRVWTNADSHLTKDDIDKILGMLMDIRWRPTRTEGWYDSQTAKCSVGRLLRTAQPQEECITCPKAKARRR